MSTEFRFERVDADDYLLFADEPVGRIVARNFDRTGGCSQEAEFDQAEVPLSQDNMDTLAAQALIACGAIEDAWRWHKVMQQVERLTAQAAKP